MARLRDESQKPDLYSMVFLLADRYKDEKDTTKTFCISERFGCLREILKDERMRGWSIEAIEKDCLLTNEAVFRGVALCPLNRGQDGKRVYFDPDEFFNIVLQESDSEGQA